MNTPISFEIAKLVKEKGFEFEYPGSEDHKYSFYAIKDFDNDWRDSFSKRREGELLDGYYLAPLTEVRENVVIVAPTITEVLMWLYEEHGIWISTQIDIDGKFYYAISNKKGKTLKVSDFNDKHKLPTEAYKTAIKYTLNNLL